MKLEDAKTFPKKRKGKRYWEDTSVRRRWIRWDEDKRMRCKVRESKEGSITSIIHWGVLYNIYTFPLWWPYGLITCSFFNNSTTTASFSLLLRRPPSSSLLSSVSSPPRLRRNTNHLLFRRRLLILLRFAVRRRLYPKPWLRKLENLFAVPVRLLRPGFIRISMWSDLKSIGIMNPLLFNGGNFFIYFFLLLFILGDFDFA